MLRLNQVDKALAVNSGLALVGPTILILTTAVGLTGMAQQLSWGKLGWIGCVRALLGGLPAALLDKVEEIRVREGRPLEINYSGKYHFLSGNGSLTQLPYEAYKPDREDTHRLLDLISNHSLYTMEEELRKGFITIPGGHRIGLSGRTVLSGGGVEHLRDITGFNVRIAREVYGIADGVLPYLLDRGRQRVMHTLILSPPQHGKTTLLRDLARQISAGGTSGREGSRPGLKVGIVDERS
ncbi:hypothetical protein KC345_g11485, partial [Hortaea werneckii]